MSESNDIKITPPVEDKDVELSEGEDQYKPLYGVDDTPPWYLCIFLGFQQYLTAFGSTITVPFVLYEALCINNDAIGLGQLINTIFFVSGVSTLLQTTVGVRLPIIQGATFAFLAPTFSILESLGECPKTQGENSSMIAGSDEHREVWHGRLRAVQGAIMVASLAQVLIGFSGIMGVLLPHIGPLAITPTITLIGLALFPAAYDFASTQWYIALMTVFLIALFSQYLKDIGVPFCSFKKGDGCSVEKLYIFKLFPVLLAIVVAWFICFILTITGALPDDDKGWGYLARTDTNPAVLSNAAWFRFPYPGKIILFYLPIITDRSKTYITK